VSGTAAATVYTATVANANDATNVDVYCENNIASTQRAVGGGGLTVDGLDISQPMTGAAPSVNLGTANGWRASRDGTGNSSVTAYVICVP